MWRIHRHIGMGGDRFVAAVAGDDVDGGTARRFATPRPGVLRLRDECAPLAGARELVEELKRRGHPVVLASSASEDDLDFFLDRLGVRDLVDAWTSADDVASSKPSPDIVAAALERGGRETPSWSATRAGTSKPQPAPACETICVLTGGWLTQELLDHGALHVYESLVELREHLDATPLR